MSDTASGLSGPAAARRWGRAAALLVLLSSALAWLGWATGMQVLTRSYPTWPQMTPWTALLLAALAIAVLVQSADPSPARHWLGRGLATAVGVIAVVVLAEYATRRAFGLDQVWFGDAVRALQSTWPGRPSPQTAISVLMLSLAVGLMTVERRWVGTLRTLGWFAAMASPGITVLAYLFNATSLVQVGQSTGMALNTALGLLLLGAAVILVRTDRGLTGWLLARPDRDSLVRLAATIAGFPVLVAVSRLVFVTVGLNDAAALAFSTAVGTGLVGLITFSLSRSEQRHRAKVDADRALLQASVDSMLDPQALLEAVRDPEGQVVDFRYVSVNRAACTYLGLAESDLVGHSQLEDTPNLEGSELHRRYAQCLQDGRPVILDDYGFFNEILDDGRRYDIRASRAGADLLSLTWRDVTDRFQAEQLLAESRDLQRKAAARYEDLMMNSIVPAALVGLDGRYSLVNPAMCTFLGYEEATLLRMTPTDVTAPEDVEPGARALADLMAGRTSSYRTTKQYVHADGHRLWGELSLSCIRSPSGQLENLAVQVVDITEQVQLRAQQAETDALLRRSMESAAVAMNLASPDGPFYQVNQAMCDFFGYDAETLLSKTWMELTHPDYLQADLDYVAELVAGRIESYRMRKQFIHADGHPIWGDLSVGCLRRADGSIEVTIGQIIDISEEVRVQWHNAALTKQLTDEMTSAAEYVKSILPDDLHGEVEVTARYLPALELGGDGFNFGWLDEDHLMVYLLDVSGHGIRPALLSASVHNLIRTNSLPMFVMLDAAQVLNRLNKLFPMEDQAQSYFTIWYGVYQASTRTLRYASAGHPPALALNHDGQKVVATPLSTPSVPIGTFDDTTYISDEYAVPPDGQVLIYSDGAYELINATGDEYLMSHQNFGTLCTTLASRLDWSLDTLVNELKALTPSGEFDDDCALVLLTFP